MEQQQDIDTEDVIDVFDEHDGGGGEQAAAVVHAMKASRYGAAPAPQQRRSQRQVDTKAEHKHQLQAHEHTEATGAHIDQTIDEVLESVMEEHRRQRGQDADSDGLSDEVEEGDDDELLDVGDSFMNCSAPNMTDVDGKLYGPDGRRKYKKITVEDQHLIRALRRDDGLGAVSIAKILKGRVTVSAVKAFIRKLVATDQMHSRDAIKRKAGSGRPRRARTPDKIDRVRAMIEQPHVHGMPAPPGVSSISRHLGISRRAVYQIMKKDLKMKPMLVQPDRPERHSYGMGEYGGRTSQSQAHRRATRVTRIVRPGHAASGILSVVDAGHSAHGTVLTAYETADEHGGVWLDELPKGAIVVPAPLDDDIDDEHMVEEDEHTAYAWRPAVVAAPRRSATVRRRQRQRGVKMGYDDEVKGGAE